jgi:hypothetical protein
MDGLQKEVVFGSADTIEGIERKMGLLLKWALITKNRDISDKEITRNSVKD